MTDTQQKGFWKPGARMTLDWIPGAGLAIAGGVLSIWRGTVVTEEKVRELKSEITRIENDARSFQKDIHEDLRETFEKLNGLVMEMKVMATEQGSFNRICTKTLEGLAARVENHDTVMMRNHTDIELLKAAGQK